MKIKFTIILKLFAIGIIFAVFGCQKDLYENMNGAKKNVDNNLNAYFINGENAKLVAKKLARHIGKNIPTKGNAIESDDGQINYETVMVVENDIHDKAYTFTLNSAEESALKFQNIAYIEKDNITVAKLITYEMTQEFADRYNADLAPMTEFKGTITIGTVSNSDQDCCGTPGGSQTIVIGGGGGGDPATNNPGSYTPPSGSSGVTGGWGLGWSGSNGGGSTSGGGNNESPPANAPATMCQSGMHVKGDSACRYTPKTSAGNVAFSNRYNAGGYINDGGPDLPSLCCIFDIGLYEDAMGKKDCEKFKKLFESNPAIRAELIANNAKTSMTTEQGFTLHTGSNQTKQANGINGALALAPFANGEKRKISAHTHNSPANSTYSIFSWEDLERMSQEMNNNQIDADFISFLSTADGTNYAYTITDAGAFKKLYAAQQRFSPSWNQDLNTIIQNARVEYYYGDPERNIVEKITADGIDNIADEITFLKMLQTLNCGITLFEVDPLFTTFTKVKLDPNDVNNILPEPCL